MALQRISKGLHPWCARNDATGKDCPRSRLATSAAWKKSNRSWVNRRRNAAATRGSDRAAEIGSRAAGARPAAVATEDSPWEAALVATINPVDVPMLTDSCEEDPFGHGGSLHQHEDIAFERPYKRVCVGPLGDKRPPAPAHHDAGPPADVGGASGALRRDTRADDDGKGPGGRKRARRRSFR